MYGPVVAIGEVLYDCFEDQKILGGAPTNFIGHVAALGFSGAIISAVGNDELGNAALLELANRNIDSGGVTRNELPTGTVDVFLSNGQPSYTINQPVAWDQICANQYSLNTLLPRASAVCFGTLAQRDQISREAIQLALSSVPADRLRILDVNLRKPQISDEIIYQSVLLGNALKLNDEEVPAVANALSIPIEYSQFAIALEKQFGINTLFVTCGSSGAHVFHRGEHIFTPARAVSKMESTVGAGDSFTAAAVCGLLRNDPPEIIAQAAVSLAAATCSHQGGLPPVQS